MHMFPQSEVEKPTDSKRNRQLLQKLWRPWKSEETEETKPAISDRPKRPTSINAIRVNVMSTPTFAWTQGFYYIKEFAMVLLLNLTVKNVNMYKKYEDRRDGNVRAAARCAKQALMSIGYF